MLFHYIYLIQIYLQAFSADLNADPFNEIFRKAYRGKMPLPQLSGTCFEIKSASELPPLLHVFYVLHTFHVLHEIHYSVCQNNLKPMNSSFFEFIKEPRQ
jgi:hypothetical protein